MNSTQIALLSTLNSANFYQQKDEETAKLFQRQALEIFQNSKFDSFVQQMVEFGYITKNGEITKQGQDCLITSPKIMSDFKLSISTKNFLIESMKRKNLSTRKVDLFQKKGTLSFLEDNQLNQLFEDVLDEVFSRTESNTDYGVTEIAAAYIQSLNGVKSEHEIIGNTQQIIVDNAVVDVQSQSIDVVKTKKRKKV